MAALDNDRIRALIEPDRVHRRVYADPEIFALEMDRIFGRTWLYVAHESQLRAPGDFVRAALGRHDVIVTRHDDGAIHVLHNRCAHRGARLCVARAGHAKSFVCPYHGWTFGGDGALEALPHRESYPAEIRLDDPERRLLRAPRVAAYRGFVFASLAADGPSLLDHLGPMTGAIDNLVDRAPAGDVVVADSSFQLEYRGNWKLHMENANDVFHPGFVHESSVSTARMARETGFDANQTRDMLQANGFSRREWENIDLIGFDTGHSYMTGFYRSGLLAPQADDPVRSAYRAAMVAQYGEARTAEILGVDHFNNLIYPNLVINAQYQQMRVVQPAAVDRTLVTGHCFRLAGAPDEMFHRAVRFLTNLSSPASMIFSDDVEIFERCQAGLTASAADWIDMARGRERPERDGGGRYAATASELPVRVQFGAWLRHMTAAAP